MRPISTAQQDLLLGTTGFGVYVKFEVETSSGGYTDLTDLAGLDWFVGATVNEDTDSPVADCRAEVRVSAGSSLSLSPFRTDSTLNQTSTGGAAPAVDIGREMKLSVATIAASCSPGSTDYELLFRGDIDAIDFARDPMVLRARDPGAQLMDSWVEGTTYEYASSSGTALETVMQNVLTDWTTPAVTVNASSSPGFPVSPPFLQDRKTVMEAQRDLAALVGWEVRYRWSTASTDFRLTFYDPSRTALTPVATFGPDRYADVQQLAIEVADVRNVVEVRYPTSTLSSGPYAVLTAQSTSSIDRYGRRWLGIMLKADSPLSSAAIVTTFANAIRDDLKDPKAEQLIDMHLFWPAQLNDVYRWQANGQHYSTDQDLAVTGITHELRQDRHRTLLRCRGAPRGESVRFLPQSRVLVEAARLATLQAQNIVAPVVQADSVRTGTSVSVLVTVYDRSLCVASVEFNKREDDGAATGWVTTWDTSTGTIGLDHTLTRVEALTVSDGKDSEFRWRVLYRDEYGELRTIEDTVPVGNLRNTSKTLRFPHSQLAPSSSSSTLYPNRAPEYVVPTGTTGTMTLSASVVLPTKLGLTQIRMRTFKASTDQILVGRFYRTTDAGGASALLATLTPTSSYQITSAALAETVSSAAYVFEVDLASTSGTTLSPQFMWFDISYDMTAYKDTY